MNKTINVNIALFLATMIVLSTTLAPAAHAVSGTAVEVLPSRLSDDTATPGSTVTFEVAVSKVKDMAGYGLVIRYNSTVLSAVSVSLGSAFADLEALGGAVSFIDIQNFFDTQNDKGLVQVSYSVIAPGFSFSSMGRLTMISIDFQVLDTGSSPILLTSVKLAGPPDPDTGLATEIPNVSVFHGYFENDPHLPAVPQIVDLSERGAWPEVRKFRISQQVDPDITFFAHVTNDASSEMVVRVIFTVVGEAFGPATFESGFLVLAPGGEATAQTQPGLGFDAVATGPGKYKVSAQVFSAPDGVDLIPGLKQATFQFQVSS